LDTSVTLGDDGTIYFGGTVGRFGGTGGRVFALNPDGSLRWEFQGQGRFYSSPTIGPDSTVYIGSDQGYFYALLGASGGPARGGWGSQGGDPSSTGNYCGRHDPLMDSDGDGFDDCREWVAGLDPNDPIDAAGLDSDKDGLGDQVEAALYLTDPLNDDSDDDRMRDGWEVANGFNPRDAADGLLDADGDSYSNRLEYLAESGVFSASSIPQSGSHLWTYRLDTGRYWSLSAPTVGPNGRLYIGASRNNNRAYILNPDSSLVRRTPTWVAQNADRTVESSPAVAADGTYYLTVYGRNEPAVHAFNTDGSLRWSAEGGRVDDTYGFGGAALATDGTIYTGMTDGRLYATYPNGSTRWSYQTGGPVYSPPSVDAAGVVYMGSEDEHIYAVNPDGTLKWRFNVGDDVRSRPAIAPDGTVVVGSDDNYIYALNPDGTLLWRYRTGADVVGSAAIGADGSVYIGSRDSTLYAFHADGSVKWTYETAGDIWSSPALDAAGRVIIGSDDGSVDGTVYALDSADGSVVWTYAAGSPVLGAIAIDDVGIVYAGTEDGKVHAIIGGSPLAKGGWPSIGGNAANTGNQCGYFDPANDSDGDGTNDCEAWYLGL
jgi:outer membrane protein assembly factor BamB